MRGEGKCERKKAKGVRREEERWDKGKLRASRVWLFLSFLEKDGVRAKENQRRTRTGMKQRMRQEVTDKTERSNGKSEKEKEEEKEGTRSECIMEEKS